MVSVTLSVVSASFWVVSAGFRFSLVLVSADFISKQIKATKFKKNFLLVSTRRQKPTRVN